MEEKVRVAIRVYRGNMTLMEIAKISEKDIKIPLNCLEECLNQEVRNSELEARCAELTELLDMRTQSLKEAHATLVQFAPPSINIEDIAKRVCAVFGISSEQLRCKKRDRYLADARACLCAFAKSYAKATLKAIGKYVGGRDHSTVINAIDRHKTFIDSDPAYTEKVDKVGVQINKLVQDIENQKRLLGIVA